jgi:hypothetical protein
MYIFFIKPSLLIIDPLDWATTELKKFQGIMPANKNIANVFKSALNNQNKPTVILANTIKGKGISFMENNILWNYRFPHVGEEYQNCLIELSKTIPSGLKDPYLK